MRPINPECDKIIFLSLFLFSSLRTTAGGAPGGLSVWSRGGLVGAKCRVVIIHHIRSGQRWLCVNMQQQ